MRISVINCYELGRQSFGVASAAAWLEDAGAEVSVTDLALERLPIDLIRQADVVAFHLPMHTATRMAVAAAIRSREINPTCHLCFFGLYAPVNEPWLRQIGGGTIIGGEYEAGLVEMYRRLSAGITEQLTEESVISLDRLVFKLPDRRHFPALDRYANITDSHGIARVTGYTEATRGCKHLCRHCPVVPVYGGRFFAVPRAIILSDIAQQVEAGAQHITFGDPDFFNGPTHAMRVVTELHERWPELTYDATIKIEHLLKHRDLLPQLAATGCILVTSAVEAVDEKVLEVLAKHHTREDFELAVELLTAEGIGFNPTFVAFTPWHTIDSYLLLLETIAGLDLIEQVTPVQYSIRLLIPRGSRLLEYPETEQFISDFDEAMLVYPWVHPDPRMDDLQRSVTTIASTGLDLGQSRQAVFEQIWRATQQAAGTNEPVPPIANRRRAPASYLSEPWYCCAEPTDVQMASF